MRGGADGEGMVPSSARSPYRHSRPRRGLRYRGLATASVGIVAAVTLIVSPTPSAAQDSYELREGQTLSHIAHETGVSVRELARINGIQNPHWVRAGQRIALRDGAASATNTSRTTHTVRAGETLSHIAARYQTSVTALANANDLDDRHRIIVGQRLQIVDAGSRAAVASSTGSASVSGYHNLPARIRNNPDRLALVPIFEHWAAANNLPTDLLMALAWQESGWNQSAVSHAGAVGVGQIMPDTGDWVQSYLIGTSGLQRENVNDNIRMSARYLRYLLARFDGDERLALGAYFQGPTSVADGRWIGASDIYVANIQAQRPMFVR